MIGKIPGLKRERRRITRRIAERRGRIHHLGLACRQHGRDWMHSSRALVQAFLAGFFVDQARTLVPGEASPVKIALMVLFRRLEALTGSDS